MFGRIGMVWFGLCYMLIGEFVVGICAPVIVGRGHGVDNGIGWCVEE